MIQLVCLFHFRNDLDLQGSIDTPSWKLLAITQDFRIGKHQLCMESLYQLLQIE